VIWFDFDLMCFSFPFTFPFIFMLEPRATDQADRPK
jgi:hypothetical protein